MAMDMNDAQVKIDGVKCKVPNCVGSANDSGYCIEHDLNRPLIPSNGIGVIVFIMGVISLVGGIFTIFSHVLFGITLIVIGIALLGFSEIINLLHRIAHISYEQYRDNHKHIES